MPILSHTCVLSALVPRDAVVEEEDVVGGHDLVGDLPEVVGFRVGLGRAAFMFILSLAFYQVQKEHHKLFKLVSESSLLGFKGIVTSLIT